MFANVSQFISSVGTWVDLMLPIILIVPAVARFTLTYTRAIESPGKRVALFAALPSSVLGAVVGAWAMLILILGYGALFCGNDCTWQHDPAFTRGLALGTTFGAGAGAIFGLLAGVLAGIAGSQLASKLLSIINTDGYQ